jgi:hypothetical protein
MAQWLGQFSGHTHETRVENAEAALRHAVHVFHTANSDESRKRNARSVRKLAERVLSARLKLLRARLDALRPLAGDRKQPANRLKSLRRREAQTSTEGVNSILKEFGAQDALV